MTLDIKLNPFVVLRKIAAAKGLTFTVRTTESSQSHWLITEMLSELRHNLAHLRDFYRLVFLVVFLVYRLIQSLAEVLRRRYAMPVLT